MAEIPGSGRALGVMQSNVTDIDRIQMNAGGKAGFFGVTPVVQSANAAQAALTLTTATGGAYGFVSVTAMNAMTAQLENIRLTLVNYGLMKGGA